MKLTRFSVIVGATLFQVTASSASPILTGSVSQTGSLYTYTYTMDNSGPGPITEISILVDYGNLSANIPPLSHDDPPNWDFQMSFSGGIADPPYNENGSFWAWNSFVSPVSPGQTLSGFSFTTTFAPIATTSNNYFLFCSSCSGDGVVEFGNVVAPQVVPEPSLFWPAGLLALSILLSSTRFAYLRRPFSLVLARQESVAPAKSQRSPEDIPFASSKFTQIP